MSDAKPDRLAWYEWPALPDPGFQFNERFGDYGEFTIETSLDAFDRFLKNKIEDDNAVWVRGEREAVIAMLRRSDDDLSAQLLKRLTGG